MSEQRVAILTPAYSNQVTTSYVHSLIGTRDLLRREGIQVAWYCHGGSALLPQMRNGMVNEALEADATDIVFIDGDITWKPEDFLRLLRHDADIVGAVQPTPGNEAGAKKYPFRPTADGIVHLNDSGLGEVAGLPTAFLRIRSLVFQKMAFGAIQVFMDWNGERKIVGAYFDLDVIYVGGEERHAGEDISFCARARSAGFKIMVDPNIELGHLKTVILRGKLADTMVPA